MERSLIDTLQGGLVVLHLQRSRRHNNRVITEHNSSTVKVRQN